MISEISADPETFQSSMRFQSTAQESRYWRSSFPTSSRKTAYSNLEKYDSNNLLMSHSFSFQ